MDLDLSGRVAIVTGGSKGIGLAVARGLAAEGARVVCASRTAPPEDSVLHVPVDLMDPQAPAAARDRWVWSLLANYSPQLTTPADPPPPYPAEVGPG